MLHVRALSGDPVAELHVEELEATCQEGSLVVALKRILAAKLGCSRFQLKLLGEDRTEIGDDASLTGPAEILMVRMEFQSSGVATDVTFVSACGGGRVTEVERLLNALQNPDARDERNNFMGIHLAARNGHLVIVRLLLEAGADKDAAAQNGITALHVAALHGYVDIVRLLLEAGTDKDEADQEGWTALHMAVENADLAVVRLLLEAGTDTEAAMQDGTTALHMAAENGDLDVVRLLLEAGADKDAATQNGATALHLASKSGHSDIVDLLWEVPMVPHAALNSDALVKQSWKCRAMVKKHIGNILRMFTMQSCALWYECFISRPSSSCFSFTGSGSLPVRDVVVSVHGMLKDYNPGNTSPRDPTTF